MKRCEEVGLVVNDNCALDSGDHGAVTFIPADQARVARVRSVVTRSNWRHPPCLCPPAPVSVCLSLSSLLPATSARLLLSPLSSSVRDLPWPGSAAKPSQGWCLIVIVKYLDASARNKQSPQSLHNCHHHVHLISHSQDSHVVNRNKQNYLHLFCW